MMKTRFNILFCVIVFFTSVTYAQQSAIYTGNLAMYHKALELYHGKQFLASQALFEKTRQGTTNQNVQSDCAYYAANCAIWLNQQGADSAMENFLRDYPTSTKRNSAYMDVADYYFENGKYAYARKWYDKLEVSSVAAVDRPRYYFNTGYAYFKVQRFKAAKKHLQKVVDDKEYGAQATYYLGFIAYEGDDYQKANELFDEVKELEKFDKNLSYFQSDMSFKAGKFEQAIASAKTQLPKSTAIEKSELHKIIGESYFNLTNYSEAIPNLKAYKGRKGKWNNTDYYQLGYAYFKQNDFEKAIAEFNKIIGGKDAVAQNAYYHLAIAYIKTTKKQEALNAFKNASEMGFEPLIKKDARYNYAKLSYEIGNSYEPTVKVLQDFLMSYPKSTHQPELKGLLIDALISSKDYKAAMELLKNSTSFEDKKALQKVAFYRGIEVFDTGNIAEAKTYFQQSLAVQQDPVYTSRATYWDAECDYSLCNFDAAVIGFKQFQSSNHGKSLEIYQTLPYNLAYAYFKKKEYKQAIPYFEQYSKQSGIDPDRKVDSYLRLGDSYFITRNYWPAMETYNKAIKVNGRDADYAYFQKAISYGFVQKNEQKIQELESFLLKFPKSIYRDDALYELGNVFVAINETEKGVQAYQRLQKEHRVSSYVPKSLLKEGLIYYNTDKGDLALTKFKKVVATYPATPEAEQAVKTARLIYVDLGRTEEYASWVKGLDFVSISDEDLDNTSYESAEKRYQENNHAAAIVSFETYLKEFPKGLHAVKSHYYLGELYIKKQQPKKASTHYEFVVSKEHTEFTEQSLARLSQFHLENEAYKKVIPLLEKLETIADFSQNKIFAQANLMKAFYQLGQYEKTVLYADRVLENPKIQNNVKNDAHVFIARSAMKTGNIVKAKSAYAEVRSNTKTGALGAEAVYYEAYFKHQDNDFKASNTVIQYLAKQFSSQKRFGAKGLLLMAKNFYGLKDAYQATYILESVLQNFNEYPEVIADAEATLQKIKLEEAKTNASVKLK